MRHFYNNITVITKLIAVFLLAMPFEACADDICQIYKNQNLHDGKEIVVSAQYHRSYHYNYVYSPTCKNIWIAVNLGKNASGKSLNSYLEANNYLNKMVGGDYYMEFSGVYHKFSDEEKKSYKEYRGSIEVTQINVFVKEAK